MADTPKRVKVWLVNETTVEVRRDALEAFRGLNADGDVVIEEDGMLWPLTSCCQAHATFHDSTLCCKGCYAEVDLRFATDTKVTVGRLVLGEPVSA